MTRPWRHLEGWTDEQVPDRSHLIGEASAYAGYSLVLLGESMCSAAINLGPELTPAQLFAQAQTRFDTAVAAATRASDAQTLNFALLGRARTELDLGNSAAAATDAALIPPGFEVDIDHDATATRRQNLVWVHTQLAQFSSVDTSIQHRYAATHDPRIAVTSTGMTGSDGFTLVVYPNKDSTATAPQAIAKYAEAQLIIAENDANTGQLSARGDDHQRTAHGSRADRRLRGRRSRSPPSWPDRRTAASRALSGRTSPWRHSAARTPDQSSGGSAVCDGRLLLGSVLLPVAERGENQQPQPRGMMTQ